MRNLVRLGALAAPAVLMGLFLSGSPSHDAEVDRLRAHFAAVERELLARDVAALSPAQRAARAQHIERLRTYAAAGVFPKNTDFPSRMVPYFIDRVGTRCAMAHLIEQDGGAALAARVAATNNNAYIAELAGDPALVAWLDRNGLTVDEAARIQPAYCGGEWFADPNGGWGCHKPDPPPSTAYKAGTGGVVLASLATIAMNAYRLDLGLSRRASGWLGVGAGVAGLGLGVSHMTDGDRHETLVAVNVLTGILSIVSGTIALVRDVPVDRTARAFRAAPWVRPGAAGVQAQFSF